MLDEYVVGQDAREAHALGGRLQPLQARADDAVRGRGHRAAEVEHPAARPDRLRQDAARPDARADPQRPVRDRRRHGADRGRLRRRGRREHPPQAHPGRRLRRQEGRDGDHLHRRGRQDRPQGRQPVDHARRVRRGRPAGAAEDPRGHDRVGAAAGRAASTRTRSSSRSTRRTSCSSAAARSRTSTRSSSGASATRASASARRSSRKVSKDTGEIFEQCLPEDLVELRADPRVHRPPAGHERGPPALAATT